MDDRKLVTRPRHLQVLASADRVVRFSGLVAIGAWVTIAVIAFDPFVQAILGYHRNLVWTNDSDSWVTIARR
jgi:hypothetical protein